MLLSADYRHLELRVLAALSRDPGMLAALEGDRDPHACAAVSMCTGTQGAVSQERGARKAWRGTACAAMNI